MSVSSPSFSRRLVSRIKTLLALLPLGYCVTVLMTILYKVLLDISYVDILAPNYEYAGFHLELSFGTMLFSYLLLFCVVFWIPKEYRSPSDFLFFFLLIMAYIPVLTLYACGGEDLYYTVLHTLFWICCGVAIRFCPEITLPRLKEKTARRLLYCVFGFFACYCLVAVWRNFGLSFSFSIDDVYEQRAAYKTASIPFAGYFFNWCGNVVFPGMAVYWLLKKRWLLCLIPLALQILLFSATGMKSMLFAPVFLIMALVLLRFRQKLPWCLGAFASIAAGSGMIYELTGQIMPFSLMVRRLLLLPAKLSFYYYDFFSVTDKLLLSHSALSFLNSYPYDATPALMIGRLYEKTETVANNGLVADGYMNFGVLGVFIWAVLLAVMLRLVDTVGKGKDDKFIIACFIVQTVNLTNSAFFTTLMTHGFLFALFFVWLAPNPIPGKQTARSSLTEPCGLQCPRTGGSST